MIAKQGHKQWMEIRQAKKMNQRENISYFSWSVDLRGGVEWGQYAKMRPERMQEVEGQIFKDLLKWDKDFGFDYLCNRWKNTDIFWHVQFWY